MVIGAIVVKSGFTLIEMVGKEPIAVMPILHEPKLLDAALAVGAGEHGSIPTRTSRSDTHEYRIPGANAGNRHLGLAGVTGNGRALPLRIPVLVLSLIRPR